MVNAPLLLLGLVAGYNFIGRDMQSHRGFYYGREKSGRASTRKYLTPEEAFLAI